MKKWICFIMVLVLFCGQASAAYIVCEDLSLEVPARYMRMEDENGEFYVTRDGKFGVTVLSVPVGDLSREEFTALVNESTFGGNGEVYPEYHIWTYYPNENYLPFSFGDYYSAGITYLENSTRYELCISVEDSIGYVVMFVFNDTEDNIAEYRHDNIRIVNTMGFRRTAAQLPQAPDKGIDYVVLKTAEINTRPGYRGLEYDVYCNLEVNEENCRRIYDELLKNTKGYDFIWVHINDQMLAEGFIARIYTDPYNGIIDPDYYET